MMKSILAFIIFFPSLILLCYSEDADNLYDLCPTDLTTHETIFFNGLPCKPPSTINASDFKSSLLSRAGDTDNFYRSSMSVATAAEFPGLNTLGLSAARTDMEVDGLVMPHVHPRASEIMFVRRGVVTAGFVDSGSRVFQKRLKEGEVFVFPKGLLHFCFNAGFEEAVVFSVLNSQNPGVASISGAMFGNRNEKDGLMIMERLKGLSGMDLDGVSNVELFGE